MASNQEVLDFRQQISFPLDFNPEERIFEMTTELFWPPDELVNRMVYMFDTFTDLSIHRLQVSHYGRLNMVRVQFKEAWATLQQVNEALRRYVVRMDKVEMTNG